MTSRPAALGVSPRHSAEYELPAWCAQLAQRYHVRQEHPQFPIRSIGLWTLTPMAVPLMVPDMRSVIDVLLALASMSVKP
jgi:hypothetical protein